MGDGAPRRGGGRAFIRAVVLDPNDETDARKDLADLRKLRPEPPAGPNASTTALYRSGPSAPVYGSGEFDRSAPIECWKCGWSGLGADLVNDGESELAIGWLCPNCDQMLAVT